MEVGSYWTTDVQVLFIYFFQARRLRKTLGGGMRQIGILCAAALVALQENIGKLENDHKKARLLAGKCQNFS